MDEQKRALIKMLNANARRAKADGYTVYAGFVWTDNGPCGRACEKVCRLDDYDGWRDCA